MNRRTTTALTSPVGHLGFATVQALLLSIGSEAGTDASPIGTRLQPGVTDGSGAGNRFNGFPPCRNLEP
jgi:hypothetical protein